MANDPQTLFAASACYACYTQQQLSLMEIALLAQIVLVKNPLAKVDPATLLAASNCYACYGTPEQLMLMKLALLAQIAP